MDLFVLALIAHGGLRSLYELQRGVGLQPGGVQPVLRRLEHQGLLKRSEQQTRRRRLMTVTIKGERVLADEWRSCFEHGHADVESVLRSTAIAVLMQERQCAHDFLLSASDHFGQGVVKPAIPGKRSAIELYTFMRQVWERAKRQAAADSMREIARALA
jgi:DNA-binding MarR family transcriptional regulator